MGQGNIDTGVGQLTQPVYLVCGVSGSGKSWVCKQLTEKFHYIPHDEHFAHHPRVVWDATHTASKPIITECPFGERVLREKLEKWGCKVIPFFVVEAPEVCASRYLQREGKPIQPAAYTRASNIRQRAFEWDAPFGTSQEMLDLLKRIPV